MKVRHQPRVVALFAAMLLGGFPAPTVAQLVRPPNPDAPILVVVTFKSADKKTGVDFAETVRDRISGDVSYRDLQVQSKQNIDATLQASGYDMTAALTEGDANLLAKQLRADEYIEGTINKNATGNGYTSEAWMVLTLDPNFVQPLGTFAAAKPGDVASQISKAYQAAHKVYDEVQKCRNARRENKFAEAMSAAASGIGKYPKSTLLRICQMATMADEKKPPADVLKVAQEILQIDPKNKSALQAEVDAYDQLAEGKAARTPRRRPRQGQEDGDAGEPARGRPDQHEAAAGGGVRAGGVRQVRRRAQDHQEGGRRTIRATSRSTSSTGSCCTR